MNNKNTIRKFSGILLHDDFIANIEWIQLELFSIIIIQNVLEKTIKLYKSCTHAAAA